MLQIAYIATEQPVTSKRQTAKEKLHADAIASMAAWRIKAKVRAAKMFEPEFEIIRQLQLKANINH